MTLKEFLGGTDVRLDALCIRIWNWKEKRYSPSIRYYDTNPLKYWDNTISSIYPIINDNNVPEIVVELD